MQSAFSRKEPCAVFPNLQQLSSMTNKVAKFTTESIVWQWLGRFNRWWSLWNAQKPRREKYSGCSWLWSVLPNRAGKM